MIINSLFSNSNTQSQFVGGSATLPRASEVRANSERLSATSQGAQRGRVADWRHLLSLTERTFSDEEMENKVREQARIDYAKGIYQGKGFAELRKQFVSIVSPDRIEHMSNASRGIGGGPSPSKAANFWGAFLNSGGAMQTPPAVSALIRAQSGEAMSLTIDDFSGNPIVGFDRDRGGWIEIFTPEERARSNAITQIYQETWNALHRQSQSANNRFEMIPKDLGVGSIDFRG